MTSDADTSRATRLRYVAMLIKKAEAATGADPNLLDRIERVLRYEEYVEAATNRATNEEAHGL